MYVDSFSAECMGPLLRFLRSYCPKIHAPFDDDVRFPWCSPPDCTRSPCAFEPPPFRSLLTLSCALYAVPGPAFLRRLSCVPLGPVLCLTFFPPQEFSLHALPGLCGPRHIQFKKVSRLPPLHSGSHRCPLCRSPEAILSAGNQRAAPGTSQPPPRYYWAFRPPCPFASMSLVLDFSDVSLRLEKITPGRPRCTTSGPFSPFLLR